MSDITLIAKSEYGDTVAVITNSTNGGAILNLSYEEERMGGIVAATFYLREGNDVPLYTGMNILLQENGDPIALFDVDGNPDNRGKNGQVEVTCKGMSARLKKACITTVLEGVSVKAACLSLAAIALEAGITIATENIALPDDVIIDELELKDENLFDLINTLITYANGTSEEDSLAWKIDTNRSLVIYDTAAIPLTALYEGHGFQSPEPEVSHADQVNSIKLWRKTIDGTASEYVATYTDPESIDKYGLFETRIELDYYVSTTDCALIARGILLRYARPARTLSVSSMPGRGGFGPHRLFLRPMKVWGMVYAGENKDVLDLSHTSGTVITDELSSMIGRYSTKCTLNMGAFGYIGFPVSPAIILPQRVRFFIKGADGAHLRIILVDRDGDTAQAVITCDNTWQKITIALDDLRRTKYALTMRSPTRLHDLALIECPQACMDGEDPDGDAFDGIFSDEGESTIYDGSVNEAFDYTVAMNDETEDRALFMPARGSIASLAEIRFQWITTGVAFCIDYIDCLAKQWQAETIGVSSIKVRLDRDEFLSDVEFGDGIRTAADELTDLWSVLRSKR